MKVLVQRVSQAQVRVEGQVCGQIDRGLVLLIGIHAGDDEKALRFCVEKCAHLRIFPDQQGKMNQSVIEVGGQVLAISQFTLYGDCQRGRRPSFSQAAAPDLAAQLYQRFIQLLKEMGLEVAQGVFGAFMEVEIHNHGPVTLLVESPVS